MGLGEDMVTQVEEATLVEAEMQDAAEDIPEKGATTVGGWDICHVCVGNREEAPKDKDHRETEEEEASVGPAQHFLV